MWRKYGMRAGHILPILLAFCCAVSRSAIAQSEPKPLAKIWRFDRIDSLGGYPTTILGHPQVLESPYGKVIKFDGVGDALFVPVHPLANAGTWTWEVIFEPDADGAPQQRFFHLSVADAAGKDTDSRLMFEIRIVDGQWCLDSFAMEGAHKLALLNCQKRYPLDQWYRVTAVYDGKTLKNYVGDELQGQGDVELNPQGAGRSSVGTRINSKDFFKGSVYESRFTPKALGIDSFLKLPRHDSHDTKSVGGQQ
jgi:hypothetical protein